MTDVPVESEDPNPAPEREPSDPVDEEVEVVLEPSPGPKKRRTDSVIRKVVTEAPEGILRQIRGFPPDAPDWIPTEYRSILGAVWANVVAAANRLPEYVEESEVELGDRVVVFRISDNVAVGTGRFIAAFEDRLIVKIPGEGVAEYPLTDYALGAPAAVSG